jgi:hypothetical protein
MRRRIYETLLGEMMDAPYVDRDCFSTADPVKVPALTFLSQLV